MPVGDLEWPCDYCGALGGQPCRDGCAPPADPRDCWHDDDCDAPHGAPDYARGVRDERARQRTALVETCDQCGAWRVMYFAGGWYAGPDSALF